MMRTSNPALNNNTFKSFTGSSIDTENQMTLQGTVNKIGILLVLVLAGALYTWKLFYQNPYQSTVMPWLWGGLISGFVLAMVTIFKPTWSPITAPLYALAEGLALGGISAFFELRYPGIVIQAVGLTFGTLFALLLVYKSGLIKVTENFKLGIIAATGGIALLYFVSFILSFFGIRIGFIHQGGILGIGFSLVVIVIAALNLVLDFDFIEKGAESRAPKYMEWYAAFGLMVTLIWLYIEILHLLAKLRGDRR